MDIKDVLNYYVCNTYTYKNAINYVIQNTLTFNNHSGYFTIYEDELLDIFEYVSSSLKELYSSYDLTCIKPVVFEDFLKGLYKEGYDVRCLEYQGLEVLKWMWT